MRLVLAPVRGSVIGALGNSRGPRAVQFEPLALPGHRSRAIDANEADPGGRDSYSQAVQLLLHSQTV